MQRSTEVESVPEASRPIRLANWITLTGEQRKKTQHQWAEPDPPRTWRGVLRGTLPFFIRVLTWSTRGRVRSWAMDSTLLGPTGFTLSAGEQQTQPRLKEPQVSTLKAGPPYVCVCVCVWSTYTFSSARGGISIDRYSLGKHR